MGRVLLYVVIAVLALFVLAAAFVLETGGGSTEAATEVSVHDLSVAPQAYAGERVSTEGVLRFEEREEQFVVSAGGLGIVVLGISVEKLRRLDSQTVAVTGRFGFDEAMGAYIEADVVRSLQ